MYNTIGSFNWKLILFSYLYITTAIKKDQPWDTDFLVCVVENMVGIVSMFTKQVHLSTWEKEQEKFQL